MDRFSNKSGIKNTITARPRPDIANVNIVGNIIELNNLGFLREDRLNKNIPEKQKENGILYFVLS